MSANLSRRGSRAVPPAGGHEPAPDPVGATADLIAAIGTDDFPARLLALLRRLAGTDFCSAFTAHDDGRLRYLFSGGSHPAIPGFAEIASLDYARRYWQRDRLTRQMMKHGGESGAGSVRLVRQAWNGISDPEYRRACYERANIVERITLYHPGEPRIIASAYRTRDSGPSDPSQLVSLERHAPVLMAAVRRHAQLREVPGASLHPPHERIVERLTGACRGLSAREANIAAALLAGRTQGEIAADSGLALSSIVTYRRRAYRKLGVTSRRGLAAFYGTAVSTDLENRH